MLIRKREVEQLENVSSFGVGFGTRLDSIRNIAIEINSFTFSNSKFQLFTYSAAKKVITHNNFVYKKQADCIYIRYSPQLTFRKILDIYNIDNIYEERAVYTQLRVANRNFIYPYLNYEEQFTRLKDLRLDDTIPECLVIRLPNLAGLNLYEINDSPYPFEEDGKIITDLSKLFKLINDEN